MATLSGLPPELHLRIANNLDNAAILALRQTSRQLEQNSHDIFIERFFHHRSHLFTVHSLEILEQISGSSLARHVKSLSLVACPLLPTNVKRRSRQPRSSRLSAKELCDLAPHGSENLVKVFSNFKKVSAAGNIRLLSGGLRQSWSKWVRKGFEFDPNDAWVLEDIYGFSHLRWLLGPNLSSYAEYLHQDDHILEHTLPAILEARLDVNSLSIGYQGTQLLTANAQSATLIDYQPSSNFWRNITDLKLGIEGDLDDDSAVNSSSPWPAVVAACSRLTKLSIQTLSGVTSTFAKELGCSLRSTPVTSIKLLWGWLMSEADLDAILDQPQLAELELDGIDIESGSWNSVCLTLSKKSLRKVRLDNLQQSDLDGYGVYFSDNSSCEHKAEGHQAVKEMLLRLAEHGHGIEQEGLDP